MEDVFKQITERLGEETSSYGALQYLQSFVARKKKSLGVDAMSQAIFFGVSILIGRGNSEDAGNALQWFVESGDLFHLNNNAGAGYCDTERILTLFKMFSSAQLAPCASVLYDPLHQVVLDSRTTTGIHTDSPVSRRMQQVDELFANIFEETEMWRSAYRVCIRLNCIARAASILDKWSSMPGCYLHEKPLFFARAILTLLADKRIDRAVEMCNVSKTILMDLDNVKCEPVRPAGDDSGSLACWHLSIILSELAAQPPAPRVDKVRLFSVLGQIYGNLLEKVDRKLVDLVDKIGTGVFMVNGNKPTANPMSVLQAMLSGGAGVGGGAAKGAGGKGPLGGMSPSDMLAMINQMSGGK